MGVIEPVGVIAAQNFSDLVTGGGVAIFPADTVYGIACDPEDLEAAARIHRIKGRPPQKPSAVMYFSVTSLLNSLDELDARTRAAVIELLPGPFTLVVPNPRGRFKAACAGEPGQMGLRVPQLAGALEPLTNIRIPIMQTSANLSGQPDAHALEDIEPSVLEEVDLALDGGVVGGTASTVIDLTDAAGWRGLRTGADAAFARARDVLGEPIE